MSAEFMLRAIAIGAGATLVMDLWAALLRRFGVSSLDMRRLGRWLGSHEKLVGWATHYAIGITFAGLLLAIFGLEWAHAPTLGPALLIGIVTVVAPLVVFKPMKSSRPIFNTVKSVVTHVVYGTGLYLAALVTA